SDLGLEGPVVGVPDAADAIDRRAGRKPEGLGDVGGHGHDLAPDQLEPRLVAERHHVADGADHAELAVGRARRRREGAAPRVAVEEPLLHQDVERLPDGWAAHRKLLAERVLGGDALALAAQVVTDRVGDLEVPRNPGTVVHADGPPAVRMSRHLSFWPGAVND